MTKSVRTSTATAAREAKVRKTAGPIIISEEVSKRLFCRGPGRDFRLGRSVVGDHLPAVLFVKGGVVQR